METANNAVQSTLATQYETVPRLPKFRTSYYDAVTTPATSTIISTTPPTTTTNNTGSNLVDSPRHQSITSSWHYPYFNRYSNNHAKLHTRNLDYRNNNYRNDHEYRNRNFCSYV